ncbi:hypothetical protein SAMN04488103_1123 [Gemmobacter aquatilis]|uniref:DUF6900 domain-containing protein n=1 Tax=Gemmobacter aquatilis TaxID=933059 RepID=A0A1H8LY33_9RHOB|nr:hypothetical protein [Gemmobacter aquatilis]SEO09798.1 hypothetical protein SAMN04488103_1123 [Gemmobacter aquatilis]
MNDKAAHLDQTNALLAEIARTHLGLPTLEERRSDSLDFHDLAVWSVKAALEAAFEAGRRAAKEG